MFIISQCSYKKHWKHLCKQWWSNTSITVTRNATGYKPGYHGILFVIWEMAFSLSRIKCLPTNYIIHHTLHTKILNSI
jgi:hypothetical protein